MKITQVAATPGGALGNAVKEWDVVSAVGELPLRTFRQVLYLRFVTGGDADGLRIDSAQCRLQANFKAITQNAKSNTIPSLAATFTNGGPNTVRVEWDAPYQVRQVQLASSLNLGGSAALEFYRLDGAQVAEKPTVTAALGGADLLFVMENTAIALGTPQPGVARAVGRAAGGAGAQQVAIRQSRFAGNTATVPSDFTDARFALRLKDSAQASPNLRVDDLTSLSIRSYPTGPRLGLADPAQLAGGNPNAILFFDRLTGMVDTADAPGNLAAGATLAAALQRYIDDFFVALAAAKQADPTLATPAQIDVALVVESDTPCRVQIADFVVEYGLARHSFPTNAEKISLTFRSGAVASQSAPLHLSPLAHVTAATLRISPSLDDERPVSTGAGADPTTETLAQHTGLLLRIDRWAGQPVTPEQAFTVSGLFLGVMALANDTKVLVALHEDFQGQPTGKKLAETTITLAQSGRRLWQQVVWPAAVLLPAQPHWLLLKTLQGAALWLAREGQPPVRLFDVSPKGTVGAAVSVVAQQGLYSFLSAGAFAAGGQPTPPLTVTIGEHSTPAPVPAADGLTFDLTDALKLYLATATGSDHALTVTSGLAGLVTVYPPEIVYEVEG
ncbi:MAG: hypothetical protein R3C14_44380 [Caldilineaceae bacterium]